MEMLNSDNTEYEGCDLPAPNPVACVVAVPKPPNPAVAPAENGLANRLAPVLELAPNPNPVEAVVVVAPNAGFWPPNRPPWIKIRHLLVIGGRQLLRLKNTYYDQ